MAFARDRDVLLAPRQSSSEQPVKIELQRGVVVIGTLRREETALAIDPRGGTRRLVVDLPRHAGATPQFAVVAEGDFGLRTEAMLDGSATTLRFGWEREGRQEVPLWDAGLGDPVLLRWREIDVEEACAGCPAARAAWRPCRRCWNGCPKRRRGGRRWPASSPRWPRRGGCWMRRAGRSGPMPSRRRCSAAPAPRWRTGPARRGRRPGKRLTEASQAAERAGAAADAAWEAWQRAVQAVLARTG